VSNQLTIGKLPYQWFLSCSLDAAPILRKSLKGMHFFLEFMILKVRASDATVGLNVSLLKRQ